MNRLMSATAFYAVACIMQFSISVETFETPELAHTNAPVDDISPKHQRSGSIFNSFVTSASF